MLLNVGSGGGAAPAAAGGAAPTAGGAAPEETKEEEKKEEGKRYSTRSTEETETDKSHREGGVRRRHGLRSLRLSEQLRTTCQACINFDHRHVRSHSALVVTDGWKRAILENDGPERAAQAKTYADYEACSDTPSLDNTLRHDSFSATLVSMVVFMTMATPWPVLMLICMAIQLQTRNLDLLLLGLNHHFQNLHDLPLLRNLDRICLNPMILQRIRR